LNLFMKSSYTLDCKFPSLYSLHFTLGRHGSFNILLGLQPERKIFWITDKIKHFWSPLLLQPTLTVRNLR